FRRVLFRSLIDPDGRAPSGGECPPNCNFEGVVRSNFGWAESGTTRVAEMLADIQETTSDAIRTVVTEGPEKLDGVTYAAGMTAVAAGGAAMIAGPTPDDAIHLTVAGIAATTATLSNTAATVLSVID